jgi:hypothetical protein
MVARVDGHNDRVGARDEACVRFGSDDAQVRDERWRADRYPRVRPLEFSLGDGVRGFRGVRPIGAGRGNDDRVPGLRHRSRRVHAEDGVNAMAARQAARGRSLPSTSLASDHHGPAVQGSQVGISDDPGDGHDVGSRALLILGRDTRRRCQNAHAQTDGRCPSHPRSCAPHARPPHPRRVTRE